MSQLSYLPQIEDADVCAGAIGTQAPILAHDLRSISLASPAAKNFCSTVFGLCPLQKTIPYTVQFTSSLEERKRELEMSGMRSGGGGGVKEGKKWKSRGREPFKVVHLSDVHVDRNYLVRCVADGACKCEGGD